MGLRPWASAHVFRGHSGRIAHQQQLSEQERASNRRPRRTRRSAYISHSGWCQKSKAIEEQAPASVLGPEGCKWRSHKPGGIARGMPSAEPWAAGRHPAAPRQGPQPVERWPRPAKAVSAAHWHFGHQPSHALSGIDTSAYIPGTSARCTTHRDGGRSAGAPPARPARRDTGWPWRGGGQAGPAVASCGPGRHPARAFVADDRRRRRGNPTALPGVKPTC